MEDLLIYWIFSRLLRSGEVLGLQWQDIDLEKNLIHVRRTLWAGRKNGPGMDGKNWWCFTSPKSANSKRDVLMIPALKDALLEHKKRSIFNPLHLLFCTKSGQPISRGWLIQRHFHPALKAAGITGVRFHDLRHSFATLLLNKGINLPFVSKQLGHASVNVTVDIYHHILPSLIADQRDVIQSILVPFPANSRLTELSQNDKTVYK
jgi:integrase